MQHTSPESPESAREGDLEDVVALWAACGLVRGYNPPDRDFSMALGKPNSDVLVVREGARIVASAMVGHDGHRGWVYYVAVDPDRRGQGLGAVIMAAAEDWLRQRDVRKVQLMVRETNQAVLGFYDALGYERSPVTVMQRWLDGTDPTP